MSKCGLFRSAGYKELYRRHEALTIKYLDLRKENAKLKKALIETSAENADMRAKINAVLELIEKYRKA